MVTVKVRLTQKSLTEVKENVFQCCLMYQSNRILTLMGLSMKSLSNIETSLLFKRHNYYQIGYLQPLSIHFIV